MEDRLLYKPGDLLVYAVTGYGGGCAYRGVVDKGFVAEDGQTYYRMTSGDLIPESFVIDASTRRGCSMWTPKYNVGDAVWFIFKNGDKACPVGVEGTKVVCVFPPRGPHPVSYCLESENSPYRVSEGHIFGTRAAAIKGAIAFAQEQIEEWKSAVKLLEVEANA